MALMALIEVIISSSQGKVSSTPIDPVIEGSLRAPQEDTSSAKSKPWGNLEYVNLPLEQPDEFLADILQPLKMTKWFFEGYSPEQMTQLFNACGLTETEKAQLLDPAKWNITAEGVSMVPSPELVLHLSKSAREQLYSILSKNARNIPHFSPFRFTAKSFEKLFATSGLRAEQLALVKALTYTNGGSVCFCDIEVLWHFFSTDDFRHLIETLYSSPTFLMKVFVDNRSDTEALVNYWGRGGRSKALKPLMESLAKVPGGTTINVSYLMPPFARLRLYTYSQSAMDPTTTRQDCFWTAMNFFNEQADNQFFDFRNTIRVLQSDFYIAKDAPMFGDRITLMDGAGLVLHMCVYIADDVVFTKNGADLREPWVLMKFPDMMARYPSRVPLRVVNYRPKRS